jgi:hypothetical protein
MSNNFYVGQKVVHVPNWSGKFNNRALFPQLQWPEPNGVYTIRKIAIGLDRDGVELLGLSLEEVPDQPDPLCSGGIVQWDAFEFRPVTFLNIDISIFQKMLQPNDKVTA